VIQISITLYKYLVLQS